MPKNILIYAQKVVRASETFIYFPAMAMRRYTPYFVGSIYRPGLGVPEDRVFVANHGKYDRIKQALKLRLLGNNGVRHLADDVRHLNPLLLQAHFGPESINALPLAKRLGIPMIVYYHGLDATVPREHSSDNYFQRRYWRQLPRLQAEVDLVLTPSDFIREHVIQLGYAPHKVRTHYIGIEVPPEPPLPLHARKPYVLFVARFTEKKGLPYLIHAMQIVQQSHPDLELVVVGDGDLREAAEAQAANQLQAYRFVGWQSPEQVQQWMREALIFCVPSVTSSVGDTEGFGMVFIEAQSVGTPVVSHRHGGIVESVAHGQTGTLVPEKDVGALAQAILQLADDETRWQHYSHAGYQRVQAEFDMHKLVAGLESIYDELLQTD